MKFLITTLANVPDYLLFRYKGLWFQKQGKWARKVDEDKGHYIIDPKIFVGVIAPTKS